MEDCIFCKIIEGKIKSDIIFSDNDMIIFRDIHPQAKIHLLAVPKAHFPLIEEVAEDALIGRMLKTIASNKELLGLKHGYRIVINQKGEFGNDAGQEVMHLHIHILAGQKL